MTRRSLAPVLDDRHLSFLSGEFFSATATATIQARARSYFLRPTRDRRLFEAI
jgi:hypothetical protein